MSKYYVLLEKSVDAAGKVVFFVQFGDVSRNCVESERMDFARCTGIPLKDLHILVMDVPAGADIESLELDSAIEQYRLKFIENSGAN